MPEDFADGEDEEEEDELEEITQHTVLPDRQDLFITLTEIPSQPNQAAEGTSDHNKKHLDAVAAQEDLSMASTKKSNLPLMIDSRFTEKGLNDIFTFEFEKPRRNQQCARWKRK
ncbi:hypothetical protein UY3_06512 [Chelonia mydas]|uniref:Uncharacterized protein n=1 Tax=Chelonia mydas TaxID=8469 RepID=M7C6W5_CHEMY|nr:hypothetical protein UY3_06512 [Chelonia mydas]